MVRFILHVARVKRLTVVMIEHDMALVTRVADRVLVLDFGEVICCDIPQVAVSDPRVIRAYLGGSGDDVVAAATAGLPVPPVDADHGAVS